ncbi:hypothetical protein ABPG74_005167 [Tetrahymena malaccensis]
MRVLENKMNDKFKTFSQTQQILDQILKSQSDLSKYMKQIDSQNNELKEEILGEISRISNQQESLNNSCIKDQQMEIEFSSKLDILKDSISKEQDNKLVKSFEGLQLKLTLVEKQLDQINNSFNQKCTSLEKSLLSQIKESQELSNAQTTKMVEEVVSSQIEKIIISHSQKIQKVEDDMVQQKTRVESIESSVKNIQESSQSTNKAIIKSITDLEQKFSQISQKLDSQKDNLILTTKDEINQLKKEVNEYKASIIRLEKQIASQQLQNKQQVSSNTNKANVQNIVIGDEDESPAKKFKQPQAKDLIDAPTPQSNKAKDRMDIQSDITPPKQKQQAQSKPQSAESSATPKEKKDKVQQFEIQEFNQQTVQKLNEKQLSQALQKSQIKQDKTPQNNSEIKIDQTPKQASQAKTEVTPKSFAQESKQALKIIKNEQQAKQKIIDIEDDSSSDGEDESSESENLPKKYKMITKQSQKIKAEKTPKNDKESNFINKIKNNQNDLQKLESNNIKGENTPNQKKNFINNQTSNNQQSQQTNSTNQQNGNGKNKQNFKEQQQETTPQYQQKAKKNFKNQQ